MGMAVANPDSISSPTAVNSNALPSSSSYSDDPTKKVRKPYTITKSRESWTEPEHDKFLEALQLFDRDWKKIEAFVGSKTVIQIRSHAQKYFMKVQKSGTNEHLPPPRPKRKATHPYPQKAPKSAPTVSSLSNSFQTPLAFPDAGLTPKPDPSLIPIVPVTGAALPPWKDYSVQAGSSSVKKDNMSSVGQAHVYTYSSSGNEGAPSELTDQGANGSSMKVLPDFAQVYNFIGSVFDPNVTGHLQKLKEMDRIDVETVLLLMRNLSINLTRPDFEDHRRLLSSYEDVASDGGGNKVLCEKKSQNAARIW
ncbi:PREDICTED: protein REVEILLE 6-like [Ipomoea nil]|uniref:protein REVEILLE 6-like n=1 Tax=Ipomoea nil TaxID=35883 RepID=UPI000901BFF6|nr:PREDICTED: protein REVEILLE 6-like [Ipomoea nil]